MYTHRRPSPLLYLELDGGKEGRRKTDLLNGGNRVRPFRASLGGTATAARSDYNDACLSEPSRRSGLYHFWPDMRHSDLFLQLAKVKAQELERTSSANSFFSVGKYGQVQLGKIMHDGWLRRKGILLVLFPFILSLITFTFRFFSFYLTSFYGP